MIGALRYWAERMFAPRFWPKFGAGTTTALDLCTTSVVPLHARTTQGLMSARAVSSLMGPRIIEDHCED